MALQGDPVIRLNYKWTGYDQTQAIEDVTEALSAMENMRSEAGLEKILAEAGLQSGGAPRHCCEYPTPQERSLSLPAKPTAGEVVVRGMKNVNLLDDCNWRLTDIF